MIAYEHLKILWVHDGATAPTKDNFLNVKPDPSQVCTIYKPLQSQEKCGMYTPYHLLY